LPVVRRGGGRIALRLDAGRVAVGCKPAGLKIDFTKRTIWPRYGVFQPIFGFAYDRWAVPGSVDSDLG